MAEWYRNYGSWIVGTLPELAALVILTALVTMFLRYALKRRVRYWLVFIILLVGALCALLLYGELY